MVYTWCNNKECSNYDKKDILVKAVFKYENGETILSNVPSCPVCGETMSYKEELLKSEGGINVSFASFNSKSNEEKASVLKARYKENLKKEDIIHDVIKAKREQATKQFFGQE